MNKKCVFLYLLICLLVVGCVTLKEPDSENQTLVVGMISNEFKNYSTDNGTTKTGISIFLRNINDNKSYSLFSQSGGLFYSTKVPQGIYKFTSIVVGSITWKEENIGTTRIEIVNGKVNNFGTISLYADNASKGHASINYNREYEQVRTLFQQRYSSSNWNQKEWINNGIN